MKSIVCEQPNEFILKQEDAPVAGEGEVLVRIRRVGICGTDLHAYKGNQPFFTYPRRLGHELSGTVEAVGVHVTGFKPGEQVSVIPYLECGNCIACRKGKTNCCTNLKVLGVHMDGGMCEFITLSAEHLLKTEELTLEQAAILEPLSIGAHAVRRSGLQKDEFVLVIGGGPIGLGVMILAKQRGAKVIAMDINEERLQFCRSWAEVDYTINALSQPMEMLSKITNGDFPTIVFDATGNAKSMMDAVHLVAHGGKLVFVGLVKSDISFSDPEFHKKELTILSSRNATREDFQQVVNYVANGVIDSDRYITHRCDLDNMIGQFDSWLKPESKVIKAIVEI